MSYKKWSELPYAGEKRPPRHGVDPEAGSWSLSYLNRNDSGDILGPNKKKIRFAIKDPETVNWNHQLKAVHRAEQNLTEDEKLLATYWGTGVPTKQITPIMDILIDTYDVSAPHAGRMLAALHSAINDAFIVAWDLKYKWDVARPNQLDPQLSTVLCTPKHPTYPSGHSVIAGCSEEIIRYFFPAERKKIRKLAEDCAESRLYALVHFPIDNSEGLRLGRQIGKIIVRELSQQTNGHLRPIDRPFYRTKNAKINPNLKQQAIPYNFPSHCSSKVKDEINEHSKKENEYYNDTVPKLYL